MDIDQNAVAFDEFDLYPQVDDRVDIAAEFVCLDEPADDQVDIAASSAGRTIVKLDFTKTGSDAKEQVNQTRKVKRLASIVAWQNLEIKKLKQDLVVSEIGIGRADGKHMQPSAGMILALKRNGGYASCRSTIAFADNSITDRTVRKWEGELGTSALASAIKFHHDCEEMLVNSCGDPDHDPGRKFGIAIHSLAGDATKSNSCRGGKLQNLRLTSAYNFPSGQGRLRTHHEVWADVHKVTDESGRGCYALVHKQLRGVQCCALDPEIACAGSGDKFLRFINIHGDDGPDELYLRNRVEQLYFPESSVLVFKGRCGRHQQSLSCGRVLAHTDVLSDRFGLKYKYYSGLVKVIHLWRMYPEGKKPGVACAGRWGAVSNAEKFVDGVGRIYIVERHKRDFRVVSKAELREALKLGPSGLKPEDEDQLNEQLLFRKKRSRWEAEALEAVLADGWWWIRDISSRATQPWGRFLFFLECSREDCKKF